MKTQIKRFSKSALAVVLTLCMLVSCMTVGIIATDAAKTADEAVGLYNNYYIEYNSAGSGTANFNSSGKAEIVATETGKMYLGFKRNDWGNDGYFGHDNYTISPGNTTWEVYQYNTNWIAMNVTKGKKYTFTLTSDGGTTKFKVAESANTTKLSKPSLKYNNATTTPVNITGSSANLTWANVTNASSYTVYKDGNAVKTNATSPYSATSTGSYTVKAIGNGTTYSDSDASNAIQLNFKKTTTIYVHKDLKNKNNGGPLTNAYIWSNSNDNWTGSWPGQAISGWTESGDYYYKSFTNAYSKFKIILNGNNAQTDDSAEYDTGKTYKINSVNTSGNNGQAVLTEGAPETLYDITVTSGTGGKIKVGTATASTSQTAKAGNTTTASVTAVPDTGYYFNGWTKSSAVTFASGNATTATVTINASSTGTLKAAFAKTNYTVTLNKNADDATAGTASVTANYGSVMPTATMPTRTGYTFAGYYDTDATSGGNMYYKADGTSNKNWDKTANTTLYARWTEVKGGAVAKAYTSGDASSTGGTVKVGTSGTPSASVNLSGIGITSSNTVTAAKKTNYSFTGWQISGENAAHLMYRFSTSDSWTAATKDTVIDNTATTIYIKTDGTSGITTSNAEVRALFVPTDYTGLTVGAQYTENGSTYTDFATTPSDVTIAANHGTNQTGVAVQAPATDPTGYVFAGWYTANGTFENGAGNAADKDTIFKPNAANAVAIAKYNKIFTIETSVDPTGDGTGTATLNITKGAVAGTTNKVVAGGSYNITLAPANHCTTEYLRLSGESTDLTLSNNVYTVSTASSDASFVARFTTNYKILTDAGHKWGEDTAKISSGGDHLYRDYTINAGTYYFRTKVNSTEYSVADTISEDDPANIATVTRELDGVGKVYKNMKLVLSQNAIVRVKVGTAGDGENKIYGIEVTPNANPVSITLSNDVTANYRGEVKAAGTTFEAIPAMKVTFTTTPASGKYTSKIKLGSTIIAENKNSYEYTVTADDNGKTVTAEFADKISVVANTNKSDRGTVSVDKTTAAPGETITITVSPKNGVLKTLTYTYGSTTVTLYTAPSQSSSLNATKLDVVTATALMYDFFNKAGEALGAAVNDEAVGADSTYTFTMPGEAVTVNATFDAYSGESNYYYYGYDASGNAISAYNGKQMTEGMISGEKFSYYKVEGRTEDEQRFKVATKATGTRRFYVETPNTTDWNGNDNMRNPYIYWFDNEWGTFEKLTYDNAHGVKDGKKWWYTTNIHEGVGCLIVNMNNTSDGGFKQTADISADDVAYGAVWISSSMSNNKYTIGGRFTENDRPSDAGTGVTYYSWNDGVYAKGTDDAAPYSFGTSGFNDLDQNYAKPKGDGYKSGSYYVLVLYPNKTYTINGVTKTTGNNIDVIWMSDLPGGDENITIYAKDGAIRSESNGSTYANIADTKIYLNNATVGTKHSGNITNQTWETYNAAKGDTLVIKTQIGATDSSTLSNAADLKAKYYVRGFCINGEVSELLDWNANGVYTVTYKVPEDYEGKNIEITPIYYLKNTTANPIVTYRVTGFTDELKAVGSGKPGWGDTLYTYPFYGKLGGQNNAFGAYPGQPMVYYKGQYQMQIPQKSTAWDIYYDDGALSGYSGNTAKANAVANTTVSGVTMSNGYYDIVHRQVMGYGSNGSSADHVQTYDYGDFYKIFNEKKPVDNIVFDFKYRTKKHNFENQPAASTTKSTLDTNYGTNGNGFELLTNFHGRTVDLFGTPLSGDAADPSKTTPVYVVSIGGVNGSAGVENIAGYYATEWMVYGSSNGTNYSRITAGNKNSIPPEVLVLNDDVDTSFNTTTYPSADANHNVTDWKDLYHALEEYRGKPVMISYEAADAQIGAGNYATSGGGGATRNDGRWLYSNNGENITSKIRVDVSHDSGATYVTNPAEGEGHVDGLSAYFTNADAYQKTTYATTIDPDKTFDFEAKTTNASYKFVGWFMEDGTKITSDNASHTERSGSYTFVARFMEVSSGQLVLSHSVGTGAKVSIDGHNYTCDGSGSASIGAVITDAETNEVLKTYDVANKDITIDEKYIGSDKNYNITVTLIAQADTNTAQGTTKLTNTSTTVTESEFFNPNTGTDSGKQRTFTFTFNVKNNLYSGTAQKTMSLIYNSYFIQYKFNYKINYTFDDRNGDTKQYKRIGTLTPAEANTYVKKTNNGRILDKSFFEKMAPVESNFGQEISWSFNDYEISTGQEEGSNYEYNITAHYAANQTETAKRNVTFVLPYAHDVYGVATLDGEGKGTKATSANLEFVDKSKSGGSDERVTFAQIPVLKDNKTNGIYTEEEKSHWIAAPQTIKDDNKELTFRYWSIKTTDHCTAQDPDVSRCYFPGFNFIAYDNYVIEAIYGDTSVLPSEYGKKTNITYVETTRNQWNSNGTDYSKDQRTYASDLLYNDFIVSYSLDGKEIYSGEADNDIADIGIVVERIKALDTKQDGSLDTTLSKYTDIVERPDVVDSVINGGTVTGFSKHSITKNSNGKGYKLDNKDRYNIYDAFYNSAGWDQTTTGGNPAANYTYKNYVYRAYSYMKLADGTTIVKSTPAYFTMYDVATANYSSN